MATSTITNTITDATGTALAGVPVVIRLIPRGAWRIDTGAEIAPVYNTTTNASGVWSATLEETANISPANSFYEVEEKVGARNGGPRKHTFQVGASNASLYASLVSPIPDMPASSYLTQAAADARYVLSPGSFGAAGDISVSRPADAAAAGVLSSYARTDHKHDRETIYGTAAERAALTGSDLFNGLHFVESDTGRVYVYIASAWVYAYDLNIWNTSYSPIITQTGVVTFTTVASQETRVGRNIKGHWKGQHASGSGTGASIITIGCTIAEFTGSPGNLPCGSGYLYDSSSGLHYPFILVLNSATAFTMLPTTAPAGNMLGISEFTAGLTTNDIIAFNYDYQAAA